MADADYDVESRTFFVTCGVCGAVVTLIRASAEALRIKKTHDEECTS